MLPVPQGDADTPLDLTHTYATNIDLTGKFETFGINHQVLVGFDYYHRDVEIEGFIDVAPPAFRPTIDIFNPVYGPIPQLSPSDFNFFNTIAQSWYGVYFQDQITLWDKLHILGGGRYDWATSRSGLSSVYGDTLRRQLREAGIEVHLMSAKRVHDACEVYDGVPSMHDAKAAQVIGRLYFEADVPSHWRASSR